MKSGASHGVIAVDASSWDDLDEVLDTYRCAGDVDVAVRLGGELLEHQTNVAVLLDHVLSMDGKVAEASAAELLLRRSTVPDQIRRAIARKRHDQGGGAPGDRETRVPYPSAGSGSISLPTARSDDIS